VDEVNPCIRKYKTIHGHYVDEEGKKMNNDTREEFIEKYKSGRLKWVAKRTVFDGYEYPERLHIDNQMPACPSCNINKHSMSLEEFRKAIAGYMKHLNEISTQYKMAKRYRLIQETGAPVRFYFEIIAQQ